MFLVFPRLKILVPLWQNLFGLTYSKYAKYIFQALITYVSHRKLDLPVVSQHTACRLQTNLKCFGYHLSFDLIGINRYDFYENYEFVLPILSGYI